MKRLEISLKLGSENFTYTKKFYAYEIAAVNLSKIFFLKNAKKTCKPNNRDLNRDWIMAENILIIKKDAAIKSCSMKQLLCIKKALKNNFEVVHFNTIVNTTTCLLSVTLLKMNSFASIF